MARFRAARHLNCFYCGRRSGIRNDGKTLEFVCRYCEATNYLDEKGEITDPPVATDGEATMTQFAAPKPPSQTDSIFCSACLKNQYLLTASLAQYLPDDPSDPDYAPLERNYHRYRRGLEKRYPQVCDQCAGRVEARLRQAGYTAKTDHLRRMMELGRGKRTASKNGLLDWVSCLGGVIWRAGFALQLLWHLVAVAPLLRDGGDGLRDPNEAGLSVTATAWLGSVADVLPGPDVLVRWTVAAAVASVWWNPYFVQLFRGFTRHLTGFKQWYSFQSLIVVFRLVCWGLVGVGAQSRQAQLSLHMAMASVMTLIYVFSRKSMRVDTSPLFGAGSSSGLKEAAMTPVRSKDETTKTLSDMLTDALESTPQRQGHRRPPTSISPSPLPAQRQAYNNSLAVYRETPGLLPQQQAQYAEEMDWSPVTPGHRALAPQPSPNKGMGIDKSPFWYKVPAAPVTPARQLRNPPRAPDVKPAMLETDRFAFSPATTREKGRGQSTAGVEFRQPQFFAPERDDANSLADLLGQSFSLSQDRDQEGDDDDDDDDNNDDDDDGKVTTLGGQGKSRRTATSSARRLSHGGASTWHRRLVEPVALIVLPIMWALTLTSAVPFRNECQAAIIAMSGLMTFLGAGEERHGSRSEQVLAAWATAELAASFWVFYALSTDGEAPWYGSGVLASTAARLALRRLGMERWL